MPPWYFQMPDLLLQIVRCELVISRILNRWKAKILLVLEEAMVELICFLLRSSCLQHPSRTMGARGLWMKQPVFSWFLRISACFTRKDLWIPTYNYWNPLAQLGTMNAVVWLCEFTRVNNIDLETFGSTYVVNYSVYYLLYFIIIIIWYRSSSTLFWKFTWNQLFPAIRPFTGTYRSDIVDAWLQEMPLWSENADRVLRSIRKYCYVNWKIVSSKNHSKDVQIYVSCMSCVNF